MPEDGCHPPGVWLETPSGNPASSGQKPKPLTPRKTCIETHPRKTYVGTRPKPETPDTPWIPLKGTRYIPLTDSSVEPTLNPKP